MMRKRSMWRWGAFLLGLSANAVLYADITIPAAANMAENCFTCHGPDGRSPGAIPSIDQFKAEDIATALRQFKSGERPSTVMGRHAKGYTDPEIDALAKYIAGLKK